jgi:hypothetical protein
VITNARRASSEPAAGASMSRVSGGDDSVEAAGWSADGPALAPLGVDGWSAPRVGAPVEPERAFRRPAVLA